jgi:hypothetical protein
MYSIGLKQVYLDTWARTELYIATIICYCHLYLITGVVIHVVISVMEDVDKNKSKLLFISFCYPNWWVKSAIVVDLLLNFLKWEVDPHFVELGDLHIKWEVNLKTHAQLLYSALAHFSYWRLLNIKGVPEQQTLNFVSDS